MKKYKISFTRKIFNGVEYLSGGDYCVYEAVARGNPNIMEFEESAIPYAIAWILQNCGSVSEIKVETA